MINIQEQLFPLCIVWTTLPIISWLLPWIGHVGICNSKGIVSDFLGYHINYRKLSFNQPLKYVQLKIGSVRQYDEAIMETNLLFENQPHNLCCNNCHHHVADVLNRISYQDRTNWTQMSVWWMCISRSQYTSICSIFKIYLPFLCLVGVVILLLMKLIT